jgi:hypothetical protein
VYAKDESGVLSSTCMLAKIPMGSKYSKTGSVKGTAKEDNTGEKDAVEEDAEQLQPSVEGSEGGIASGGGATKMKVQCKTTIGGGLPTPDPTPSPHRRDVFATADLGHSCLDRQEDGLVEALLGTYRIGRKHRVT